MSFDRGGGGGFRRREGGGFRNPMWPFPPGGFAQQQPSQFNPPGTQWLQDMLGGGRMPAMPGAGGMPNTMFNDGAVPDLTGDEKNQYDQWLAMLGMQDNPMLRHVWTKMRSARASPGPNDVGSGSSPSSKPAGGDTPTPNSDTTTPITS